MRFFSILSVDSSCITSRGAGDQTASTIGGGKLATDTWHPLELLDVGGSHYVIPMGYMNAYILMGTHM